MVVWHPAGPDVLCRPALPIRQLHDLGGHPKSGRLAFSMQEDVRPLELAIGASIDWPSDFRCLLLYAPVHLECVGKGWCYHHLEMCSSQVVGSLLAFPCLGLGGETLVSKETHFFTGHAQ